MVKPVFTLAAILFFIASVGGQSIPADTPASHFREGIRLLQLNSLEEALASFERSARLDDKQPATFANIGMINLKLLRHAEAEATFRKATRLAPENAEFFANLCVSLSLQRKHTEAIEACDEAVELDPDSDRINSARVSALTFAGRIDDETARTIGIAVDRFRNSVMLLSVAADYYIFRKNFYAAVNLLQTLTNLEPDRARHHGILAEVLLNLGRDPEALASARRALQLEAVDPHANFAMGLILFELGEHNEAIEAFSRVNTNDEREMTAKFKIGMSKSHLGQHQESVDILRPLAERSPTRIDILFNLGSGLASLRQFSEAKSVLQRALAIDPENPGILAQLGLAHASLAEFDQAIEYHERNVKLNPGNEIYQMFLNVARSRQRTTQRLPEMIADIENFPNDTTKLFNLASALGYANRLRDAERYIKRIYELDPDDEKIYHYIGIIYAEGGNDIGSIDAYKRSLAKKENLGAHLGLAGAYRKLGRMDEAIEEYKKVIAGKPDAPSIMKGLADALRERGRRREALEMYQRSISLNPLNPAAIFQAGLLSVRLGEIDAARNYLTTLRSLDPQSARTLERCIAINFWN
jgi:tetratricopeptide (TPR) repeat protein